MSAGRNLLVVLVAISAVATAVADLSYIHAGNSDWPPHARLHAIWGVAHVLGTHSIALYLLSVRPDIFRIRIGVGILLAYALTLFVALLVAPLFGASVEPDLLPADMPPKILGLDGNVFSFLIGVPLILLGWWLCEKAKPVGQHG